MGRKPALSQDLRERIVAAYERGEGSYRELAQRFGVSKPYVGKLVRQKRELGHCRCLLQNNGRKRLLDQEQQDRLRKHLQEHPDATVAQRHEELKLPGSEHATYIACRRLGWRYKKSRSERLSRIVKTSPSVG